MRYSFTKSDRLNSPRYVVTDKESYCESLFLKELRQNLRSDLEMIPRIFSNILTSLKIIPNDTKDFNDLNISFQTFLIDYWNPKIVLQPFL